MQDCVFFYNSPLDVLEIQLKAGRIYSISKVRKIKKNSSTKYHNKHASKTMSIMLSFLNDYFSGNQTKNKELPLFPRGTVFQRKVWRYLQKIPYGETNTYAEIAKKVGSSGAARAVGSACAQNPYLILVPCHRVVAQKGLGGFALGLSKKRWLLNHEKSIV